MAAKLLIVDDDMDTLRLVGLMLERQGYEIIAASGGRQGLILAKSERPDLILLDVMMPDIDGFEVTQKLREDEVTADIPIIIFTAKNQLEDKLSGFDFGADDYLTKPTQPRELFAHIKAVLSRASRTRELTPVKERGKITAILAAKGGLGVTTLTLNLGIAIRQSTKKEVIIAEFIPGKGTISIDLGYSKPEGYNPLLKIRSHDITAKMVEAELVTHNSGVRLLLSSIHPSDAKYIEATNNLEAIAQSLWFMADFVLLDLGSTLTQSTVNLLELCHQIILVVEPRPQTVIRTKVLIQDLVQGGIDSKQVHIALLDRGQSEPQSPMTEVEAQLGYPIETVFTPASEVVYQSAGTNLPLIFRQPDSVTAKEFFSLANIITQSGN
jgi:CheY-like chemotaxis protein/MinD-like ATPase involved in chromosome partitioning or flagellar assembly